MDFDNPLMYTALLDVLDLDVLDPEVFVQLGITKN
jgi:hypothetical protein